MISLLSGTVRSLTNDRAVVDVGGIGLSVLITSGASSQMNIGAQVQLFTTLVVREDSLTLFGFLDEESRTTFELVQTVSGIGPKVALAIMGAHSAQSLALAVMQEDIKAIEKVPGIGRKGAQRLILELKGKISDYSAGQPALSHQPLWREQLASALVSLGFTAKDSDNAINIVIAEYAESGTDASTIDISDLLKKALQSGRRS